MVAHGIPGVVDFFLDALVESAIDLLPPAATGLPPVRARPTGLRADVTPSSGTATIELREASTDRCLGTITEEELQVLTDALEEEWPGDRDYYVDADTVQMLEDDGAPATLVALLRAIVGAGEGVELYWRRA